jgi:signal transduction histidine kinase
MTWVGRICLAIAILFALPSTGATAQTRRVLLLHSYGPQFVPWTYYAARFREELVKQSPEKIDLYEASLESARFAQVENQGPIIEYLRSLFAGRDLDLIVTIGAPAARFAQRFRQQFFPSTPLIIAAAERRAVDEAGLTSNDTYVPSMLNFTGWIEHILQVLPDTKHIAWAVGASPLERFWTEQFRRTSEPFTGRVTFEWFNDLSFEQMLKRVAELPPNSAVLYVDLRIDAAGVPLDSERVLERLNAATRAPIFSYLDAYLGRGIVGGPVRSVSEFGQTTASVAIRILGGESPGSIKLAPLVEGTPTYDWRELQRWNISENRLPSGSRVLFRQPSLLEQYRLPIFGIVAALLLQASLIFWLIYEHRRRTVAEVRSRNSMAELTRMNRIATAGQLSASIAHEVGQPLTRIGLNADAALRLSESENPDLEEIRESLGEIAEASQRADQLVQSLRAMFRKGSESSKAPVNINKLFDTVLALVRVDLRSAQVQLETQFDETIPSVEGNAIQLQQVILNLVMNAVEAMRGVQPRVLKIRTSQTASAMVNVWIEDSGTGISEADRARVFNPLFTTKPGGMGIGLAICQSIIADHGGRIWVSAAADRGAIFQFELPATGQTKAVAASASSKV